MSELEAFARIAQMEYESMPRSKERDGVKSFEVELAKHLQDPKVVAKLAELLKIIGRDPARRESCWNLFQELQDLLEANGFQSYEYTSGSPNSA